MSINPYFKFHPSAWFDENQEPRKIDSSAVMEPPSRILPGDGLQFCDPDLFWEYQFGMTLDAESELRMFLATLVTYHQTRKLAHFLTGFADVFELNLWKNQERLPSFRFRCDFSPRISVECSTKHCGFLIFLDGKQDLLHSIPPVALDDLRKMIVDVWEILKDAPIWQRISETNDTITVRWIPLI